MDVQQQELEKMKIKELRKERFRLLDDIHEKQQQLDQIDYQIYQKKNEEGKGGMTTWKKAIALLCAFLAAGGLTGCGETTGVPHREGKAAGATPVRPIW